MSAFLPGIIGALVAACVGGVITWVTTNWRNSSELALKITDRYADTEYAQPAKAKVILRRKDRISSDDCNTGVALANWFEVVALCYLDESADRKMLDALELPGICRRYYQAMTAAVDESKPGVRQPLFTEDELNDFRH